MLKAIGEAGYEGVELMQHPKEFDSAEELYRSLRENKLKLLGLTGGSILERAEFIDKLAEVEARACVGSAGIGQLLVSAKPMIRRVDFGLMNSSMPFVKSRVCRLLRGRLAPAAGGCRPGRAVMPARPPGTFPEAFQEGPWLSEFLS